MIFLHKNKLSSMDTREASLRYRGGQGVNMNSTNMMLMICRRYTCELGRVNIHVS